MSAFRVAFVGGLERLEPEIVAFGRRLASRSRFWPHERQQEQPARGGRPQDDLVVIVTGTNGHNAVRIAKRAALKSGLDVRILKFCGAASARALLAELAQRPAANRRAAQIPPGAGAGIARWL